MKKTILREYAKLVAQKGLNVQKGQDVWITCELDQPEFVQMVVEECYKLKARDVRVEWTHQPLTKINVKYKSLKDLGTYEKWQMEKMQYQVDHVPCRLFIESEDPDGLKDMDVKKMAKARQMLFPIAKKYRDQWENKDQWCIVAVPSVKWAKKLFPSLSKKQAVEELWKAILKCARADKDPLDAWDKHNKDLINRCNYLNGLNLKSLHYEASNGTNFDVGLIDQGCFAAGLETSLQGYTFNPNMPSEECFTSPMRGQAEGIVYSSMPLSYNAQLIENFWIKFKDGKAVEWNAQKNNDLLTEIINMDEGSSYLGECALVPYSSPIRQSNILFYSTLFDENAACHLALGAGFQDCIKDYQNKSLDECRKLGINESMMHVDFMIGTKDMNITGMTKDNKTVQIFKNGEWAF